MTGLPEARYRSWRPGRLADWEITEEGEDPETSPERRAELEAERERRCRERAAARQRAVQAAALATTGGQP